MYYYSDTFVKRLRTRSVFPSLRPSAGELMGPEHFETWRARAPLPTSELGEVVQTTAPHLSPSGACGLAVVGPITG